MLRPPPFPISIDQLTANVLSDALETEVTTFDATRIGADRGMLGEIFLIEPTYAVGGTGPRRLVAKFAALRDGSLDSAKRSGAHERELRCYAELLSDTPVSTPHMYGAWYDPDTAHFLLLQDAVDADESVDQLVGLDLHQARLVLSEIARLHTRWIDDPGLASIDWLPRLDSDQRRTNLTTLAGSGWEPLCDLVGNAISPHDLGVGDGLAERVDAMLCRLARQRSTLIHSDLRADNLLFSPDGSSVWLIDWQGCGLGPPGFDLAYFLSQSLTVETRRAHEDDLLDFYRDEITAAGGSISDAEIRAAYGEAMLFGLTVGCALPLIGDPEEPRVRALARTVATRSIEALRDHHRFWEEQS